MRSSFQKPDILALTTRIPEGIDTAIVTRMLSQLPQAEQMRLPASQAHRMLVPSLFGRLLLRRTLHYFDSIDPLSLQYTKFGKPYIPNSNLSFSISHSGDRVICAVASDRRIGADLERISDLPLDEVSETMNPQQWAAIHAAVAPLRKFFDLWTMKESIAKSRGEGLGIPFGHIRGDETGMEFEGELWTCRPIPIAPEYSCHIAHHATKEPISVHYQEVNPQDLLLY